MTFWSTEKWKSLGNGLHIVDKFDVKRLKHGAYELSLGDEYYETNMDVKRKVKPGEQFNIPAGHFAMLITHETITIPIQTIGFISIKTNIKFKGLINVSGFHVDPGFHGKLKFSVYNAGVKAIPLTEGEPTFLLWLTSTDADTKDKYDGKHNNQNGITDDDVARMSGEVVSLPALNSRLTDLKTQVDSLVDLESKISELYHMLKIGKWVAVTAFAAAIGIGLTILSTRLLDIFKAN